MPRNSSNPTAKIANSSDSKTSDTRSLCHNYKHFPLNCAIVCVMQTTNCYLTFLDIGAYSKNCDSRILQKRFLRNKISGNEFNIPDRRYLTEDSRNVLPHVFIDNEAFGLSTHIMRPYWGNNLSVGKRVQKYGQSRAKRFIERAFGILTN